MNVPEIMRLEKNWVCWKSDKRPYQIDGAPASSTNPKTWSTYEAVVSAGQQGNRDFKGVGFVFTKAVGIVGIDLDGFKEDGATPAHLTEKGKEIISRLNSYSEVSPSGRGAHIYIRGVLPEHGRKFAMQSNGFGCIELYDDARYFTVTGNHIEGTPLEIFERQAELDALLAELSPKTAPMPLRSDAPLVLSDAEIIDKCRRAANSPKFERLWSGDTSDYAGDESRADAALCSLLSFYTRSESQIDSLFRQSGLMRPKWNRQDYRNRTLKSVMNMVSESYTPRTNGELNGNGSHIDQAKESRSNGTGRAHKPTNVEPKPAKIAQVEMFLSERYEFRTNQVTSKIEFRPKEPTLDGGNKAIEGAPFKAATDYDLNSLERELAHNHLPARALVKILYSDYVPLHNPFVEYLNGLPKWNGERDFITEFFKATVRVKENEDADAQNIAAGYFKKWIVATVSTWRGTGAIRDVNQTMLVFTGEQGRGKTTWQMNLMPTPLRDYLYVGSFDAANRDNLLLLSDKGLIIFDELDSLRGGNEAHFKQAISRSTITARRAYGRSNEDFPRRAAFIGSLNHSEFLGDTTGTRRFLVVEVDCIDNEFVKNFPLDMMYAQAWSLLRSGFQYWFDSNEVEAVNKRNAQFAVLSIEEDLVLKHAVEGEAFLTASEIAEHLSSRYKSLRISPTKIGAIMKKHGFARVSQRNGKGSPRWGYLIKFESLPNVNSDVGF